MTDTKNTIKKNGYVFLSALLVGILINSQPLFFSTDATDSLRAYGSTQAQESSGRFIGHILDLVMERMGFYQPFRFINVLIYLVFLAASAALVVMILDIGRRCLALSAAAVLVSCAMNSGILAYYYVCHMYGFSLFLSVLACFLLLKKRAVLAPVFLLVLSLGIYQAFFPTVLLLIFLHELTRLMDEKTEIKEWFLAVLRYMAAVLAALAMYILLNRLYLSLAGVSMSGYLGMSENVIPSYTPAMILDYIGQSFRFLAQLPFTDRYFLSDNGIMQLSLGICIGLTLLIMVRELAKAGTGLRKGLLLLLFLALPCFINLPMLMQGTVGERFSLNWYFILIVPLVWMDRICPDAGTVPDVLEFLTGAAESKASRRWKIACGLLCTAVLFGAAYSAYRNVNIYTSYAKTHEIAEHVVLDVENRFADCEDYGVGDEILFVGSLDARTINDAFFNIEYQEYLSKVFNRDHSSIFRRYGLHNHRIITPEDDRVLKFSLGDFGALEEEDIRRLPYFCVTGLRDDFPVIHSGSEEIRSMPSYPDAGCVRKIDGILVCKFSD